MKVVGLFEAKTKLSELCQRVAKTGEPCTITCRGEPLVRMEPARDPNAKRESIWTKRKRHIKEHGMLEPDEPDFELPAPLPYRRRNPLA